VVTTLGMSSNNRPKSHKKRLVSGVFFVLLLISWWVTEKQPETDKDANALETLYATKANDAWVELQGTVSRLLPDDMQGSRHQKFILTIGSRTVLVAHNIDLAQRVPISVGDKLGVRGQYEWNQQGGVVHWTHHDPQNRHSGGWIEWQGKKIK